MTWDPTQIGDLRGRTYLITGANGGIGYFAADQLLRAGADVIVAGRNPAKLDDAISALSASAKVPAAGIGKLRIDTSSIESSTKAAAEITGRGIELDGLILNAGLVHGPKTRTVTPEGHELFFATNILGHFAFVGSILDSLTGAAPHIVWLGSSTAIKGEYSFTDPELADAAAEYKPMKVYAHSKAATTMVGAEAARRFAKAGSPIASVIAHPGYALGGRGPVVPGINEPTLKERIVDTLQAPFSQTKELGAHALVRAAVDPQVTGGEFVGPKGYKGPTQIGEAPRYATDQAAADRLWDYLEKATGVIWP
ncbi:SDR family NAD(P)-dependent oxidoreductase [Gordonia amarae]|uniref:SDR family NAD(P)-dependent oxidoreductase n=2 Tax=Gordonia amarae TaxID=36821 RepID=A0A857L489_9ACTN|nr:SDR family NAD(P)-dependent oxidoreductase [Gordonia amarae]MCS3881058.1 NAD(P)-dependent dehydrogenase (short-subunit alcohol dehydrogenase family) [Gordonia amarae]QHN19284.1 SDR family NAD(P)-dependent oxidoreductase [Gordonia amarae]QHN23760.1 SDR family NAD(P)-dependent oxidoreductase [Gordonia amarae]QHN32672.1 SDR family NAD(P)-dependent oxidoreductase [Gordonia amarae]QHN41420.1 SDR family NAD(P)-dependent oxidoreductase [Gordonia amarae]